MRIYRMLQPQPNPTAVALGLFDGVHLGHRAVIAAAKASVYETAVFTFDMTAKRPDGKVQAIEILTAEQRLERLAECGVESVQIPSFTLLQDLSPEAFFETVLVQVMGAKALFCGEDYRFGKYAKGDVTLLKQLAAEQGMTVTVIPKVCQDGNPVSSTRIRMLLQQGQMAEANRLLGSPYEVHRPVIFGKQLGRTIDCPTINQDFPADVCQPKYGVYLAAVELGGKRYTGVANLGVKPTVEGTKPLLETHILDVSGDFYGEMVKVQLLQFMRPEQKFESIAALSDAIHHDIVQARLTCERGKSE